VYVGLSVDVPNETDNSITIYCQTLGESEMAFKISIRGKILWLPYSQIVQNLGNGFIVTRWWYEKNRDVI
jgi:hypothetical protein